MLQEMSEMSPADAPRRVSWPLIAVSAVVGGLVAASVALWLHYGTTVFFEIVNAGIAACF